MSKITETSRLRVEDFQKQRDWIAPLIEAYNSFLSQTIRVINGGINFADNVVGLDYEFSFTFQTQALTFPQQVKWPFSNFPPRHLVVTYSTEEDLPVPVLTSWNFTDARFVQLKAVYKVTSAPAISNLVAGNDYKIRVRIEP